MVFEIGFGVVLAGAFVDGFGVVAAGFGVAVGVEAGFAVLPAGGAVLPFVPMLPPVVPPVAGDVVVGVVVPVEVGVVVGVTGWPGSGSGRLSTLAINSFIPASEFS